MLQRGSVWLLILGFTMLSFCFTGPDDCMPIVPATGFISDSLPLVVPLGGNSWLTVKTKKGLEQVTDSGWINWQNSGAVFSTYIKINKPGSLRISAFLNVPEGESRIQCTVNNQSQVFTAGEPVDKEYPMGAWNISKPGYVKIDMRGISKTGILFAKIRELLIAGTAVDQNTAFVKNNEGNYFYWGRRGPSVHIQYDLAEASHEIEWFYNEINVPRGNDKVGSYFMANGFAEGYFGIQVNSVKERRILFSVWSPFKTDNPSSVPDDQKIKLLKKGLNVHAGEFGNEGSGGQSYLKYNWQAGRTYCFLLHAQPATGNNTIFTAYFYAPETKNWMLIASFSRPHTDTYLTKLHSFLENFDPLTGNQTRKAWYQNQWIIDKNGNWLEISKMTFTGDATANAGFRADYGGGEEKGRFFLKNCGFFNDNTALKSNFTRLQSSKKPEIDLSKLN